jgi:hypothetical protein
MYARRLLDFANAFQQDHLEGLSLSSGSDVSTTSWGNVGSVDVSSVPSQAMPAPPPPAPAANDSAGGATGGPCLASKVEKTFLGYFRTLLNLAGYYEWYRRLPTFRRYLFDMIVFIPFMCFSGAAVVEIIFQVTKSSTFASNVVACVGGIMGHMLWEKKWWRIAIWGVIMAVVFLSVPPPSVDELAKLPQTVRYMAFEEECVKRNITSTHAPFRLNQLVHCKGYENTPSCKIIMEFAERESKSFVEIKNNLIESRGDLYSGEHKLTLSHRNHSIGKMGIQRAYTAPVSFPFVNQRQNSRMPLHISDADRMFMVDIDITDKATRKAEEDLRYTIWVNGWNRLMNRVSTLANTAALFLGVTKLQENTWYLQLVSLGSDVSLWWISYVGNRFGPSNDFRDMHREICDLLPCPEEKAKTHHAKPVEDVAKPVEDVAKPVEDVDTPTEKNSTAADDNATATDDNATTSDDNTNHDEEVIPTIEYYGNVKETPRSSGLTEFVVSSMFYMYLNGFHRSINIQRPSWLR